MINSWSPKPALTDLPKTTYTSTVNTHDTPVKAGGGHNIDMEEDTNHMVNNNEDAEYEMIEETVGMHSVNINNICS